jgi:hypothetical protein
MTCIRLLASKRRSRLKEILYTRELVPGMRSRPRQSARISINTGASLHSGQYSQNCRSNTCAHCSWPVCAQVWRRVVIAAAIASRFRFWLRLSLGYGLDSLIHSCYSCLVCYSWGKMRHPLFGYLAQGLLSE